MKYYQITDPRYRGCWYYHIWEVGQLFDCLELLRQEPELQPYITQELQNLTREEFEQHVKEAHQIVREFDSTHLPDFQEEDFRRHGA